ncbi:MAG TPA: NAD(P)H-hydrate epimerase, partial [Vicinamibacteria bacterium]|nr:NAD(P)H-hydrate epimerase [Vicinamibacteria bacterium]
MLPLLSALEMREADRRTIEEAGLPGAVLMENAGAAVAAVVKERYPQARRPLVVCGKGNNGGDGYAAARRLLDRDPEVALLTFRSEIQGDAAVHLKAYEASGGRVTEIADEADFGRLLDRVGAPSLVIDAVFGTGLRERPTGLPALAIEQIAAWALAGSPVVAVDIPSG